MIISGVQGMIDGIFVGNFVGSNALASVNISLPFFQLIIGVSMVISIGTQSYVGLSLGQKNTEKAQNGFHTFKILTVVIAFLIKVLGLCSNREAATLIVSDSALLNDTDTYIRTISLFAVPMCLMFYFGFLCRIVGKPERYFYGCVLSIIVNVSLDYLLIARLDLGVGGAALATGLAYSSALLFVAPPLLRKNSVLHVFCGKFSAKCIPPVLYNGSSEGVNSVSIALTAFLFNVSLMQRAGAEGVAAFTAINYIGTLGGMLLFGISDGIGPLVSYNFGAHHYKRVRQIMRLAYCFNLIFGVLLFCLLFFFTSQLAGLFIQNNQALIDLAVTGGRLYSFSFLLSGFNILNSGYFTFIGKGLESVLVAASRGLVFVSIGILVLPRFLSINGIWLSVPFAEFCAMIVGVVLLCRNAKQLAKNSTLQNFENSLAQPLHSEAPLEAQTPCGQLITINRQFGSGGREVGKRLSEALHCAYYDKERLADLAKKRGIPPEELPHFEPAQPTTYTFSRSFMAYRQLSFSEKNHTQIEALKTLAQETQGVFVGMCSDHVLHSQNPLKVFIFSSDMDFRIDRCFAKVPEDMHTSSREHIREEILAIDAQRGHYYKSCTGENWQDMSRYHLCIDTSKVGVHNAVELLVRALAEHNTGISTAKEKP